MDTHTSTVPAAEPAQAAPLRFAPASLDQALHAQIAWWTRGLSPASLVGAYFDWLAHLAGSPDKQLELLSKAQRKLLRLGLHATADGAEQCEPCIEPLPQDRRFSAPEWQQWPFDLIYQAFLLGQQWCYNATTDVPGVTRHHEQVLTFAVRQTLDTFAPSNFVATNPLVLAETWRRGGLNLVEGFHNWVEDAARLAAGKPLADSGQYKPGRGVALTPGKVVFRNRLIELIQYAPQSATTFAQPVLIVPPWIMKFYILDLAPGNSLVRYLVDKGHTVFMISWKNPQAADRDLGMDDYLSQGVLAAIDAVNRQLPGRPIQAMGYCLGGTLLAIAAAALAREHDQRLCSLTLLAAQLDFTEPGELGLFIDESQLAFLDKVMADKGYLDGKQMEGAFALLNSKDMVWSRVVQNYLLGKGQAAASELAAWNADATRMPYRQQSEYLRSLYLNNDLAQGRYLVDGKPVALSDIRVPLFVLGTRRDTVSPWTSVYKVQLLTDTEVTFCLTSGGHNAGVVNPPGNDGTQSYQVDTRPADGAYTDPKSWEAAVPLSRGSWWPAWERWLRQFAGEPAPARPIADPALLATLDDAPGRYVVAP